MIPNAAAHKSAISWRQLGCHQSLQFLDLYTYLTSVGGGAGGTVVSLGKKDEMRLFTLQIVHKCII